MGRGTVARGNAELSDALLARRLQLTALLALASAATSLLVGMGVFSDSGGWSKETFLLEGGLLGLTLGCCNAVYSMARLLSKRLREAQVSSALSSGVFD